MDFSGIEEEKGMKNKDNNKDEDITIKVNRNLYIKFRELVRSRDEFSDIKSTLNKIVKDYVLKEEFHDRYKPFLYIINCVDASMFLKDEKINKIIEVIVKYADSKKDTIVLYCASCKSDYCIHTAFTAASNEIGSLKAKNIINK